jgi:hypothetical protein
MRAVHPVEFFGDPGLNPCAGLAHRDQFAEDQARRLRLTDVVPGVPLPDALRRTCRDEERLDVILVPERVPAGAHDGRTHDFGYDDWHSVKYSKRHSRAVRCHAWPQLLIGSHRTRCWRGSPTPGVAWAKLKPVLVETAQGSAWSSHP